MRERALTVLVFALLAVGAFAFQGYGLPETWIADEMTWVIEGMLARRSFDPRYFMYPSFFMDACYVLARLVGADGPAAVGHVCRSVSAVSFLLTVLCMGRTVELVLGRRLPFAYFFSGTSAALIHHAHMGTVNSCFFFTIMLAVLQFVRTAKSAKESDFYLSVLACSLAVGAKYNGCFLFGALPVLWLVAFGDLRSKRFLRALAVSLVLAPLPYLATTPYCLLDHEGFHDWWVILTEVEGPLFRSDVGLVRYVSYFGSSAMGFFTPPGLALLAAWGLVVYGAWILRWRAVRAEQPLVFRASVVIGACFFLYLVMNWQIRIFETRYFIPPALMAAVLFLFALHGVETPRLRRATIAVFLVLGAANAWANVLCFHLAAKARAGLELERLEGRIGVIAYTRRHPFAPGSLEGRTDVFMTGQAADASSYEEYLAIVERFFAEKKPRWVVFEGIVTHWPVFNPRQQNYSSRLLHVNPGLEAWDAALGRAGYRQARVIESCEGPLAVKWLIGGYYLWTAEGVGRPVYVYERRPDP